MKKKAKGKSKAAEKKAAAKKPPAKNSPAKKKKGKDIVQVRENINELVKASAKKIASKVIEVAETTGQLASAKYLFEAVGLYPATEQTAAPVPLKDTLAYRLLTQMGIPTEPVICEDEPEAVWIRDEKGTKAETAMLGEDDAEREDKDELASPDGE